eukprot:g25575.t1
MIIEGVAFDIFGLSEDVARQASSTVLAVFTFAVASSVTIGGIIYDASGWKGMSVFHTICQVVVLLLFVSQPAVLSSFWEREDSDTFQHHFAANSNLRETIAQRRGLRAPAESDDEEEEEEKSTSVPKDLRFPLLLCVMCCFNNTGSYRATHSAEAENVSCLRRMILQPYNIACLLFGWVLCNLGMVSPLLPIAVTAQIIMGTLYVYTIKMTTDLNLFYSMGDTALFVKLQGFCKNAEALGGGIASWIGPFLYATVNPFFPFIVSTCMSLLAFLLFTAGFGHRVGCLDIDSAEEQRSQRLGKKRVSRWSVASRKSTVVMPEIELEES